MNPVYAFKCLYLFFVIQHIKMNKYLILLLLSALFHFSSCIDSKKEIEDTKKVSVIMSQLSDANEVFSKVELIPLESSDSSLLGNLDKIYLFDDKYYAFLDKYSIISIFDKKCILSIYI